MKKITALLLVTLFLTTLFSTAFADVGIEEKILIHSYTWEEVVAYDGYSEGNIVFEALVIGNLTCFQQLVWALGEETADQIDLKLAVYDDGSVAVRCTKEGQGVHYWMNADCYLWMHSSIDNKIHVLLTEDLVDQILDFAETIE